MISLRFHHASLKSMVSVISSQTAKGIETLLLKHYSNLQKQEPIDLQVEFNVLTLPIIASSAFGSTCETINSVKDALCRILTEILDATGYCSINMVNEVPFLSLLPFWKNDIISKEVQIIGELVDKIIADHRQGRSSSLSSGTDLLDLLLSAVDEQG